LDGTTFQPGVATPLKQMIPGFRTRGLSLSVKWTEAAELFFSKIEGKQNLEYWFGPLGSDLGMTGITGFCNCMSWTGPVTTVDGIITGTVELRVNSRIVGTFDATGAVTPAAFAAAEIKEQEAAAKAREKAEAAAEKTAASASRKRS
jgi:hypothetical protein